MITKQYGVYSVMGNFGSWKTFWTFLEISQLDKEKNFIIANVPYKFVDLFYSKAEELYKIIESLEEWIKRTNNDVLSYYFSKWQFKNIVIIVDEAHLYFNARKWDKGGLMERLDVILTQCRKRNIKIFFISQRLKRVDINIRRMTDFVIRYKRKSIPILWIQRSTRNVYENEWDLADIQGDDSKTYVMNKDTNSFWTDIEKSKLESSQFLPLLRIFRLPIGKRLSQWQFKNFQWEAHNSFFISGLPVWWTRTKIEDWDLEVVERPLTEREEKIKAWIAKNLPGLVKLLKPKQMKDGQLSRLSITDDKGSNSGSSSVSGQSKNDDNYDWLNAGNLWHKTDLSRSPKRIAGFRELREFEDRISDGANSGWNSRTQHLIKGKVARTIFSN